MSFDVDAIRKDFPILKEMMGDKPLVFLDSAASAQKPESVIETISHVYRSQYANVERGVYELSRRATDAMEGARAKTARFLGAEDPHEIVFVRNATEALNLIAYSYGREHVGEADEVLITHMEHHANLVPWQVLCKERGATLRVAPIDDRGDLILDEFEKLVTPRTKVISVTHVSNALGTIVPVEEIVRMGHAVGAAVIVDGAQAVPHQRVDIAAIGCDFYVFSGHKLFGPSGIGALWGRRSLLEAMPPFLTGGGMILSVTLEKSTYQGPPHRFEAGTPDIAGAAGLGAAIDYVEAIGLDAIAAHEHALLEYATDALEGVPGLRLIGTAPRKAAVLSFVLDGAHPHDIGTILDREGIAVRTGHHCAQPVMDRFAVPATVRASLALYNDRDDVDALVRGLHTVREILG
jgi:cysteine desulfurase/selenocysteine lyase